MLFLSHRTDTPTLRAFDQLQAGSPDPHRCIFLHDADALGMAPDALADRPSAGFHTEELAQLGYPMIGSRLIPGHAHFPVLDWLLKHPDASNVEHVWLIEHDVRYAGRWNDFFNRFANGDADLLTARIVGQPGEPDWEWWDLTHPTESIPLAERRRAFLPVYRLSRRAAETLHTRQLDGWTGHFETLVPTLLHHAGLHLADFAHYPGKPNDLTPAPIACTVHGVNRVGKLRRGGFRYRPPFVFANPLGLRRGQLIHPVKPPAAWWRHNTGRVRDVLGLR